MDWEWMAVQRLGAALVGVLLGSLLPAEAVARWRTGRGTRTLGLRPGAYDTARRFGAAAGALVLLGDAGKTAAACAVARAAVPELGGLAVIWAGLGAVAGHCYSFWHRGRGGPGTAVLAGWVVLCLPFTGVRRVGGAALTLATGVPAAWRGGGAGVRGADRSAAIRGARARSRAVPAGRRGAGFSTAAPGAAQRASRRRAALL